MKHSRLISILSAVFMLLALPFESWAQGSIFGAVLRSSGSVPTNGEISFVGYLDNTDEEIRIESSVGAGYDGGFWFDDFQNFQTEAAGNPYDYLFFDLAQGEGVVLSGAIPDNSFQQEDVTLGQVSWPAEPSGVNGRFLSGDSIEITWTAVAGTTVHVYRRIAPSAGSFFRIDDPTGSLGDPGVAGGQFVDTPVDSALSYEYLLIAEDAQSRLGHHSSVLSVSYDFGCCVYRGDINHSGALPLDISDLVYLIDYMFLGGAEPFCHDEADINGDGADTIDISDLIYLIDYMFQSGPAPFPCP